MELKHYLVILRRWGWIMILCTALASTASYWFSSRQPRVYESVSRYLVGAAVDNPNVNSNDLRASSQVGQTYASLAETRPLLQNVIDKLKLKDARGNPMDASVLASNVTASWLDTSQVLTIRVRASDPVVAADVANALGDTLIERSPGGPASLQAARRQAALTEIAKLQETIRATEAEIDQLTNQIQQSTDQVSQRALIVRLDQRRAQLATAQRALTDQYTIVQSSGTNQIAVMEQAVPNYTPIAPEIVRNVLAALIAGLVLGLAAMLLFEYFTDVIYTPEELRKATALPYLGGIARRKRLRGSGVSQIVVHAQPETLAAESYRMLRTNLQIAGSELQLPSLLITSASRGDGKTEIATNLAISLAQAGKSVILVDANLRRPRIGALFGLPEERGLSNLLDLPAPVLEPLPIDEVPGLSVLPAGQPVLNSSDIVGSQRMQRLILDLKVQADVIIFDSPPLLYSDALALAQQADGVLLVANSGTTGRENMINAVESLRLVGAHLLGTVLNRVKAGPAYSYYPSRVQKPSVPALAAPPVTPTLAAPDDVANPQQSAMMLHSTLAANEPKQTIVEDVVDLPQAASVEVLEQPEAQEQPAEAASVEVLEQPEAKEQPAEAASVEVLEQPEAQEQPAEAASVEVLEQPEAQKQPAEAASVEVLEQPEAQEQPAEANGELLVDPAQSAASTTTLLVEPEQLPADDPIAPESALDIAVGTAPLNMIDAAELAEPGAEMIETGTPPVTIHANGRRPPQDEGNRSRPSRRSRGRSQS